MTYKDEFTAGADAYDDGVGFQDEMPPAWQDGWRAAEKAYAAYMAEYANMRAELFLFDNGSGR